MIDTKFNMIGMILAIFSRSDTQRLMLRLGWASTILADTQQIKLFRRKNMHLDRHKKIF